MGIPGVGGMLERAHAFTREGQSERHERQTFDDGAGTYLFFDVLVT